MSGPLLTVKETASRLSLSESWVRRHRREMGGIRLGRSLRFDPDVLFQKLNIELPTERSLEPLKGDEMLQHHRYQRGSVQLYRGRQTKTWYGTWREDVIGADGKLKRRQRNQRLGTLAELPTKQQAREALRVLMGSVGKPKTEMTLSELVTKFEALHVPTLKASTGRYRLRMLKSKSLRPLASVQISKLTRADVEAMVVRESKRYSDSVVRGLLSSLSQALAWARDHEWLEKNVADRVKLPRSCGGRRVQRYVCTAGQINDMVNRLHEPHASLVLLMATTGLRIGEAIAIRQEDFIGPLLYIRRRLADGEVDTVKTVSSERQLPIPDVLAKRLQGLSREGWIFQTKNGTPLNIKNVMRRHVKPAAKLAGLASINWHSFRHSFTVSQRRQGTHPKMISELLGHASVATAMDAYDHSSESELAQPLDRLLQDVMKSVVAA